MINTIKKTETILITGGAGFIGSHLQEHLLENTDWILLILDDLSSGLESNIIDHERVLFIQGNVTDKSLLNKIFNENNIMYIVHLAAIASVQECIKNPVYSHEVNALSTLLLLEFTRNIPGFKRIVFASSAAVYGDLPGLPKSEISPVCPISPYGIDKYSSERYILSYSALHNIPSVALRFFNVFGPRQNPLSPYSGVLSIFFNAFFNEKIPTINIFGDGKQTRDFIYVKDIVQACLMALSVDQMIGQVFNVGNGRPNSLLQIIDILSRITAKTPDINFMPPRAGDIKDSYASIERISSLGFEAEYPIEKGLKNYWDFLHGAVHSSRDL